MQYKITQYNTLNIKLMSNLQLNKLKSGIEIGNEKSFIEY